MLCVLEQREVSVCPKRTMCLCKENTNGSRNVCEEGPRTRCYQIVHPKNKTFYYFLNLSLSAIWLQTGKWNFNKYGSAMITNANLVLSLALKQRDQMPNPIADVSNIPFPLKKLTGEFI